MEAPCVGSGNKEDRRPPTRPADDVGSTIDEAGGRPPVEATKVGRSAEAEAVDCEGVCDEPGTIKGPWKLADGDDAASDEEAGEEVPERMTSGSVPVGATC